MLDRYITGVGIDISEHHVRLARVTMLGRVKELLEITLPEGLIADEQVVHVEKAVDVLRTKLDAKAFVHGGERAVVLFPESRVFAAGFIAPRTLKGDALVQEARKIGQRDIPIPFAQADVAVSRGDREAGGMRTTVYAIDSVVAKGFLDLAGALSVKVVAAESNSKSLLRLLTRYLPSPSDRTPTGQLIAIVDIGHSWTSVTVHTRKGSNLYSRSIAYPKLVRTKKTHAMLSREVVDTIYATIREVMVYFQHREQEISQIFLCGVEASDEGLLAKGKGKTAKETHLAFVPVGTAFTIKGVSQAQLHAFGSAIGAALRAACPWKYDYQHNFIHGGTVVPPTTTFYASTDRT